MELIQVYLKSQITRMIIDIYLKTREECLDNKINSREALQHLWHWRMIPDDLFEEADLLLEKKSTNMEINEINNKFLEIVNFRTQEKEDNI